MPARINRNNTTSIIRMTNNLIIKPNPPWFEHMVIHNNISIPQQEQKYSRYEEE
jgi:hypothetical protein